MEKDTLEAINTIQSKHKQIVLQFKSRMVYWCMHHHRYLDPEDAPKVLLGACNTIPKRARDSNRIKFAKILYLTEPL